PPPLPPLSPQQQVHADYRAAGLSLRGHPLAFVRAELDALGAIQAAQLADWPTDRPVRIAGLVLMRQRPGTAKGITFVTLEDETGSANLIVHPRVWKRCELAARRATALLVTGRVERKERVIHVIASRLEDMAERLQELRHRSRDFR
ncbi:MAG TPA: OB-fold nucleic acid binding domain-containing protein, partial [Lacipirellulaceae bacterium]|nr:OB-fold nucleic acid binding domain-containing protein [Lacipirellulaceae bacterium]